MIEISHFPHVIAGLNLASAIFLACGYFFIRRGFRLPHKRCMLGAIFMAVMFLIAYIYYHANAGLAKFGGEGAIRTVYFSILIIHMSVASSILVLAPMTAIRALKGQWPRHRKIARWTLPLWFFVSLSGLVVYAMAVHLFPAAKMAGGS